MFPKTPKISVFRFSPFRFIFSPRITTSNSTTCNAHENLKKTTGLSHETYGQTFQIGILNLLGSPDPIYIDPRLKTLHPKVTHHVYFINALYTVLRPQYTAEILRCQSFYHDMSRWNMCTFIFIILGQNLLLFIIFITFCFIIYLIIRSVFT